MKRALSFAPIGLLLAGLARAQEAPPRATVPAEMTAAQARPSLERSLAWLVSRQNEDGSWATPVLEVMQELGYSVASFRAWQMASVALAVDALRECQETPERRKALERGLGWLCTAQLPRRGSDWDIDYQWTALYGLAACVQAAGDARFAASDWKERIAARGRDFQAQLERTQVPEGGWGYYDFPFASERPKWATSFSTAGVLPALKGALELGWCADARVLARATSYVESCALPNGAWAYDWTPIPRSISGEGINQVKGSLGRIQVCNWALASVGVKKITPERVREGLAQFFEHHKFLDIARMREIPHEAYYYNAAYFYLYGHYYAARAIELLPEPEREAWFAKLRPHLVKVQEADGSSRDMLAASYESVAGTAFSALALIAGERAGAAAAH